MAEVFGLASSAIGLLSLSISILYEPISAIRLYGASGLILWAFGSRTTWRTQAHVLGEAVDSEAMDYKQSVQDECNMVSVTAALIASIAFAGFSLNNLSETHWVARAFFLYSLISSLVAVYYASTQQRVMGRLLQASQIRGWIRGTIQGYDNGVLQPWARPQLTKTMDPKDYQPTTTNTDEMIPDLIKKCFTPSVTSVISLSAPQILLSSSLMSLLLAVGVYFGFIWTRHLDTDAGPHDSRNIVIVYIVSVVVCFLVYSISRLITEDDPRDSRLILIGYVGDYISRNPDIVAKWRAALATRHDTEHEAGQQAQASQTNNNRQADANPMLRTQDVQGDQCDGRVLQQLATLTQLVRVNNQQNVGQKLEVIAQRLSELVQLLQDESLKQATHVGAVTTKE